MINWFKNNRNKINKFASILLVILGLINLLYAYGYKYSYVQLTQSDIFTNMLCLSFISIIVGCMTFKLFKS